MQITSAHDSLCLRHIVGSDDGAGHDGTAQRPGNGDFADRTVMARARSRPAPDGARVKRRDAPSASRWASAVIAPPEVEIENPSLVEMPTLLSTAGQTRIATGLALFARLVGEGRSLHSVETWPTPPRPEPFIAIQIAGILFPPRFGSYDLLATGVF